MRRRGPHGLGPWRLAWRRLRRNKVRARLRRRCSCCSSSSRCSRRSTPTTSPTRRRTEPRIADTLEHRRQGGPGRLLRRRPDRPDVARAVLPRRRRQRPRRHGAPALRRPQLALHRHLRHAHHDVPGGRVRRRSPATSAASTDAVVSRALDVLWAFPVLLLGVALGVALATGGLHIGPISIEGNSLWIPTLIIGVVNVAYLARAGPRPGAVAAREREFVEAARAQGAGALRIMFSELRRTWSRRSSSSSRSSSPTRCSSRRRLSFLGAGVQPPNPSWGTMISDGLRFIVERSAAHDRARPHARADRPLAEHLRRGRP